MSVCTRKAPMVAWSIRNDDGKKKHIRNSTPENIGALIRLQMYTIFFIFFVSSDAQATNFADYVRQRSILDFEYRAIVFVQRTHYCCTHCLFRID